MSAQTQIDVLALHIAANALHCAGNGSPFAEWRAIYMQSSNDVLDIAHRIEMQDSEQYVTNELARIGGIRHV